jgi:hypothetical protein
MCAGIFAAGKSLRLSVTMARPHHRLTLLPPQFIVRVWQVKGTVARFPILD